MIIRIPVYSDIEVNLDDIVENLFNDIPNPNNAEELIDEFSENLDYYLQDLEIEYSYTICDLEDVYSNIINDLTKVIYERLDQKQS